MYTHTHTHTPFLCSAWKWLLRAETLCFKFLKKKIYEVVLDYILSFYSIIGSQHNGDALPKNYKNYNKKMGKEQPEKYWNIRGTENVRYKDKTRDQGRA